MLEPMGYNPCQSCTDLWSHPPQPPWTDPGLPLQRSCRKCSNLWQNLIILTNVLYKFVLEHRPHLLQYGLYSSLQSDGTSHRWPANTGSSLSNFWHTLLPLLQRWGLPSQSSQKRLTIRATASSPQHFIVSVLKFTYFWLDSSGWNQNGSSELHAR